MQEINQYLEHCESSQLAPNVDGAVIMLQAHNDFTESIEEAYTDVTDTGKTVKRNAVLTYSIGCVYFDVKEGERFFVA